MNADAVLPGVGRVWLADFGTEGPWGRFAVQLDLMSSTRLAVSVTHGKYMGGCRNRGVHDRRGRTPPVHRPLEGARAGHQRDPLPGLEQVRAARERGVRQGRVRTDARDARGDQHPISALRWIAAQAALASRARPGMVRPSAHFPDPRTRERVGLGGTGDQDFCFGVADRDRGSASIRPGWATNEKRTAWMSSPGCLG